MSEVCQPQQWWFHISNTQKAADAADLYQEFDRFKSHGVFIFPRLLSEQRASESWANIHFSSGKKKVTTKVSVCFLIGHKVSKLQGYFILRCVLSRLKNTNSVSLFILMSNYSTQVQTQTAVGADNDPEVISWIWKLMVGSLWCSWEKGFHFTLRKKKKSDDGWFQCDLWWVGKWHTGRDIFITRKLL